MSERVITAIDLGSSKICVIIALLHDNNKYEIKGVGISESRGIENGLVRDLQRTAESINSAVEKAQEQAKIAADNIFVAVSGQHIRNKNTEGRVSIAIGNQSCEIDQSHVDSVINDAKNSIKREVGSERLEILHCIPQDFDIDSQKGILNPIGMSGFSVTVHTHIILAETNHLRNIRKAFEMSGLTEPTIVLGSIATAESITSEDERRLGCIVLDIGQGTSELMIYQSSYLKTYLCIPKGGSLITNDLAIGLRTPPSAAENLKIDYANAYPAALNPEVMVEIEGIGGRQAQRKPHTLIAEIVQTRLNDILDTCYKGILGDFNRLDTLTAGMVMTGGTSLIENIQYLIEDESGFNLPCRIAYPEIRRLSGAYSTLDNPMYSCVIGLLYYGMNSETKNTKGRPKSKGQSKVFSNIGKTFKNIFTKISEL
ncbi:MAG: cell division protein FtsA [Candidatus Cloacimonetes bacterium]|nr:cell division protein FtsA [Candidatus Cloacimonadota bacterium]